MSRDCVSMQGDLSDNVYTPYEKYPQIPAASDKYVGSVRFFRQLILLFFFILLLSLAMGFCSLLHRNRLLMEQEAILSNQLAIKEAELKKFQTAGTAQQTAPSFQYQKMYPAMHCFLPDRIAPMRNTVFLTFDDGPSKYTAHCLDILAMYGIKATFFVVGKNIRGNEALLKRMLAEGHTIGIHTYSHVYPQIYSSVNAYINDFHMAYEKVYETTGYKADIFRFPGGTVNLFNRKIFQNIAAEMIRRNFTFYDWNVSAGDADKMATPESVFANITSNITNNKENIVLMHDTSSASCTALEKIILDLKKKGFKFSKLTNNITPVTFYYY